MPLLLILVVLLSGCSSRETKPVPQGGAPAVAEKISSDASEIQTVYYPDARIHPGIRCSVYYSKPDKFLLKARRWSSDELEIGMNGLMWFWFRSHDPKFAYVYSKDDAMLVKDLFRPDVIASMMGADSIESEWTLEKNLARASAQEGDHERVVFADSEKIVGQEIRRGGETVGSIEVLEFNNQDGRFLPRKIRIRTGEEDVTVDLGDVQINGGKMDPVPSKPTKRLY